MERKKDKKNHCSFLLVGCALALQFLAELESGKEPPEPAQGATHKACTDIQALGASETFETLCAVFPKRLNEFFQFSRLDELLGSLARIQAPFGAGVMHLLKHHVTNNASVFLDVVLRLKNKATSPEVCIEFAGQEK